MERGAKAVENESEYCEAEDENQGKWEIVGR